MPNQGRNDGDTYIVRRSQTVSKTCVRLESSPTLSHSLPEFMDRRPSPCSWRGNEQQQQQQQRDEVAVPFDCRFVAFTNTRCFFFPRISLHSAFYSLASSLFQPENSIEFTRMLAVLTSHKQATSKRMLCTSTLSHPTVKTSQTQIDLSQRCVEPTWHALSTTEYGNKIVNLTLYAHYM